MKFRIACVNQSLFNLLEENLKIFYHYDLEKRGAIRECLSNETVKTQNFINLCLINVNPHSISDIFPKIFKSVKI